MTHRAKIVAAIAVLSLAVVLSPMVAGPGIAQTSDGQSVEEMTQNFKKQKTRGLVIATPGANAAASAGTETTATTQTSAAVEEMATAIPKEEQVNVNISFDFDSAALRDDQKPKLVSLCSALKAADVQMVRILGHTDASGSAEYNERLSRLRAEEVKRFLTSDCGFPADRMEAQGVGERFPYDAENPRADVNRRVEFQALG
ncbi:OmpA family protein [Sulfitobacter sabulilitoris]|uniref:OmpA family protein n=1 Tax=Sulfitobacter sabulilitoris TaxID=2562655 RepID=A0A5S3PIF7_9RHOB|nr:OmpA family protein [Sulfitobacter sabulilitoris]TMM54143.1 OmpA family protein [Sulfitobacter sabulilitoris]